MVLLLFTVASAKEKRRQTIFDKTIMKNAVIVLLLVLFLILSYPFDFGRGIFRIVYDLGIIYLYLFFIGIGIYFLFTPEFLKKSPMFGYLPVGYGLLILSIINVYVISMDLDIIYSFGLSLIIGIAMLVLSLIYRIDSMVMAAKALRQLNAEAIKTFFSVILLLLIVLSPILGSDIPTTPCRIDIDATGYATTAQFLLEGGTVKTAARDILFQVDTQNIDTALNLKDTALKFNSNVVADFLFIAGVKSVTGIISLFAFITQSDNVYKVQFLSLCISYMLIFGFVYYTTNHLLRLSDVTAFMLSIAIVLNNNLLNIYYEGMYAQFFYTPFLFFMLSGYYYLRQKNDMDGFSISKEHVQTVIFFAFIFAGIMSSHHIAGLVFIAFFLVTIILDIIFRKEIKHSAIISIAISIILGFLIIFPHSLHLVGHYLGKLKWIINVSGFWQPHWASPAEILGIFNLYTPEYTQSAPRLLVRSELDFYCNVIVSIAIFLFILIYLVKKKDIDQSFWLAAPVFVFLIFIKAYYLDHANNYTYMKAYTILLPLLLILCYKAIDFQSNTATSILSYVASSIKYVMLLVIILNGVLYIHQYSHQSKIVTSDMFKLYEYNKDNKNIFDSYVLITNKGEMDEFMIVPLIPFHWLNQGIYKNPKPHLDKKVALFVRKIDSIHESVINKYRDRIVYENASFVIIDTNKYLKESYDQASNKSNSEYYTNQYKDLLQLW